MSKPKGQKLKNDFISGKTEISKYGRITNIQFVPGRPGEEYYEVLNDKGLKFQINKDEKRRLDQLIKKVRS